MRRIAFVIVLLAGFGVGMRAVRAEPPHTHEYLTDRPSGFWTSNRPAVGGSYRYRLLGIGVVIAGGMGVLMYRLIKKANAEREQRTR
jgi:hypothetical protein